MTTLNWRVLLQLVLGLTLSFLFFYMMSPFLIAIFLGGIIAIVCYPIHDRLSSKLPAPLSALLVTLLLAVGIFFPVFAILYSTAFKLLSFVGRTNIYGVRDSLSQFMRNVRLNQMVAMISRITPIEEEWIAEQSGTIIQRIIERLGHFVGATLSAAPTVLLGITVTVVTLYFLLLDGGRFARFLMSLSPLKEDRAQVLFRTFETSCRGVVLGLFVSGSVQGALLLLLFLICGLPNALLMGCLTAILGMVPLIGSSPVWLGASIYLFLQAHPILGMVMLVGGVAISTADNVVRSAIMSGQSELHPLLALVSVFGAVNLFGAAGIILGPIIAAVFVAFLKIVSMELNWQTSSSISTP